ncbi:MAG: PqqD family protein [Clostridia bacterium]|nr:PqqD family protein [Clostridia bacterium]
MKIKPGFELREIADNYVVIPTESNVVDFSSMIMLNEVSAFLWLQLMEDKTEGDLLKAVLKEYDVDKETASGDIKIFIKELAAAGVIDV